MELYADIPRMVLQFDDLHQSGVGIEARAYHAGVLKLAAIGMVELIAVTMTLGDEEFAVFCLFNRIGVDGIHPRAGQELAGIGAETHGAAFVDKNLLVFHHIDDIVGSALVELDGVGIGISEDIACELDSHGLHPHTDTEARDAVFAAIAEGMELTLDPARAESGCDENALLSAQGLSDIVRREVVGEDGGEQKAAVVVGRGM